MAYEFTKLSSVETATAPSDNANVLIEEDGIIKKAPKSTVGGGGAGSVIELYFDEDYNITNIETFREVYENDMTIHIIGRYSQYDNGMIANVTLPNIKTNALFYNGYFYSEHNLRSVANYYDGSYYSMLMGINYQRHLQTGSLDYAYLYCHDGPSGFEIFKCYATPSV